jgi:hypothetical protein
MPFLQSCTETIRGFVSPSSHPPLERLAAPWPSNLASLLLVIAVLGIIVSPAHASFITALSYTVDSGIDSAVAVGDFDGDGNLDVVVAISGAAPNSGTVSILLGNGDGTFQTVQSYAVGWYPKSVAVGDFNGDGHLDVVVANSGFYPSFPGSISILLGNGDGTFQAPQSYAAGLDPSCVAVGDFNGDGYLDLAVSNPPILAGAVGMVSILLGNGDGTFQAAQQSGTSAQNGPLTLAVADLNHDGHLDVVLVSWITGLTVLLGNGDGTFQPAQDYPTGTGTTQPSALAVGDFNGDSNLDVAVADYLGNDNLSILLGNGNGTFQAPQSFALLPATSSAGSIAVGDFNGDSRLDLAVAGTWGVSVFLSNGDGTFQAAQDYGAGHYPFSVAVGDFNRDGIPDLAVSNISSGSLQGTVNIFLAKGDGTFRGARIYPSGSIMAVADFNGDGVPDLATAGPYLDAGTILLGAGDGTFQAAATFAAGGPLALAVGDFNGDGKPDIVTTNYIIDLDPRHGNLTLVESDVRVFLGNGDGTFREAHKYATGLGPIAVAVADLNGDGIPDLIVANGGATFYPTGDNTVSVLLGNGDGTFRAAQSYPTGLTPVSVAVGDFNGDGHPDIVVANGSAGTVGLLLGKGDGTFQAVANYAAGSNPVSVAVGDFNGDGIADVAVADRGSGTVIILLGKGDGTFQPAQSYAAGNSASSVAVADFNRDGKLDIAVGNPNDGKVSIWLGNGDGSFQTPLSYAAGSFSSPLVVRDFNGDGWPDLVAGVTVLVNTADWH